MNMRTMAGIAITLGIICMLVCVRASLDGLFPPALPIPLAICGAGLVISGSIGLTRNTK